MADDPGEDDLLREVTLRNANAVLAARRRAEEELAHSLALMRATLEAASDAILATDDAGAVTASNRLYAEVWRVTPAVMASGDHWALLDVCGRHFDDPARFLSRVKEIYAAAPPDSYDLLDLADGRVVERFSRVQLVGGRNVGRVWTFRDITGRVRAERALAAERERLRITLASIGDAVISTDAGGRVTFANGVAEGLTGWPLAEAAGRPLAEVFRIVNETTRAPVENPALRALAEGVVVGLANHTLLIARDGTERPIDDSAAPMRDGAGATIGAVLVFRDITDRKRTEGELRDIRSRMEAALVAGAIGTWTWDVPADRFFGDASLARMFSLAPEDVAGGPLSRIVETIHPDDRARVGGLVDQAVASGTRYEADYRVAGPDGSWRWVSARGTVERDDGGRAVRFPGVVIDVTERKWAEDALASATAESERRRRLYEAVLSGTPDFVYVFSLDHRVLYANDALIEMWGRGVEGAIGKTFLEIGYEPWHAEMHGREIDQVRATRQPVRGEVPFDGTHGRRIYDYIFVPVLGADGEVEVVAGTTRDVTDRKVMEDELREADRKKDDFIALLAHELRNPLAPIRNGLQVVRLATDRAPRERSLEMMERQLAHMVGMIDDLLDVSRIGRNKMELRRGRVSLADVVSSAVETARPAVEEAGHELFVTLPPGSVLLDADLTRLSQVFSNLLTNSAKYTGRGGKIWLSAGRTDGGVVVSVRDTGIGIPARALPTVFDMFSQVDRPTERHSGGLGIGLALVKGLVEMHGGTVTADSAGEGCGSTFTVSLPVPAAPPDPTTAPSGRGGVTGPRRRILVVDDNQDGADSLAMMLSLVGNEVVTAHDGLEAVERAEQFRPEVILMDVGMPKMSGLEATQHVRERTWGQAVTIIALTGWGQETDRTRSHEAGCDGHLVKPVDLADLNKLLVELRGA